MALTIVLGLAILSVANYGNTFEFSGLDPSVQSKTQIKPTLKPLSSFTNQPGQGDQAKSAFAGFKNVVTKPFGSPFDSFKPAYQPYQSGPFRANYQPFGPYPGYPGPVVYPGHGGYPGSAPYPPPPQHFNDPNQRPFGFQPFPGSPQQSFNPFKFGSTKKFNKNLPGLAEFNLPGKYFQEHQFGAYHGPEFSSAIVPAEHNIKKLKPKDTFIENPAVPSLPELGFPKQNVFGFAPPPPSFRYPLPSFPVSQPFFNAVPTSTTGAPAAAAAAAVTASPATTPEADQRSDFGPTAAVAVDSSSSSSAPSSDESATAQPRPSEVTGEPSSATPAADPQPAAGPSQEEAAAVEASTANNEVPAAVGTDDAAREQSEQQSQEAGEPGASSAAAQEDGAQSAADKSSGPVVVEQLKETSGDDAVAVPAAPAGEPAAPGATAEPAAPEAGKSGEIQESLPGVKPTEPAVTVNVPGLPNELYSPIGDVPVSVQPYLGASGYPYNFGQTADSPQPALYANYEVPKFTEEDLKRFEDSFRSGVPQQPSFQVYVDAAAPTVKIPGDAAGTAASPAENGDASAAVVGSTPSSSVVSGDAPAAESGEKKDGAVQPEAPKKTGNTVQIIQEDPFNGQFPLLFDPSNAGGAASPLDSYRFYSHPSVSALSTQASLASYSPEDAFASFGSPFRQGYLVEGAPTLTPVTKTVVATGQVPVSISSESHPLHSQVFRFSQSFVPYPEAAAALRSFGAPSTASPVVAVVAGSDAASFASTTAAAATAAADAAVQSTTEAAAVENASTSSSTETTA